MFRMNRLVPATPFDFARPDFDRLFDALSRPVFGETPRAAAFPALNVWEDGERLIAEAEVPGFRIEDIDVAVVADELTIKGRRQHAYADKATIHRQERGTGEFARSITLPCEIEAGKVEATLKDGVLTIVMPKGEPARARKIAVKAV